MRIYCLIENSACPGFESEHGLSFWIEARGRRLLFDAGQSGAFAENAARLGIDLAGAEAAVLSHGHYDHSGGMERFFELNAQARLYARAGASQPHWSMSTGQKRYIGISGALASSGRYEELPGDCELFPGFLLFGSPGTELLPGSNGVLLGPDGESADDFRHEQSLVVEEGGRHVLIAGCAHRGIVNIVERCVELTGRAPELVIGGFHLAVPGHEGTDEALADATARRLMGYPGLRCCTGHCTGEGPFGRLGRLMGGRLTRLRPGLVLEP